ITFRVRAARIAALATFIAIAGLALFPLLPGDPEIDLLPYCILLFVATAGAAAMAAMPWRRLLQGPAGDYLFYAWSAADIVLIALVAATSGGGRSPLVLLYAATTLF